MFQAPKLVTVAAAPPAVESSPDVGARLSALLCLERPLAFFDLETTGVSPQTDRIVEIAVVIVRPDGTMVRWSRLVHPDRAIPAEATKIHGIADADVQNAPRFEAVATELAALLSGCDIAGFNVARFDLQMLAAELQRAGVPFDPAAFRVVDAMAIFHKNERRDLAAAVRFYCGREHDGAHRAAADIDATVEVLAAQLARYDDIPRAVPALADYCEGRQPDWITSDGKIAWRDGAARITFGKHAGKSLASLVNSEPAYLRWILDGNFAPDLKQVVERALAGDLPSAP